MVCSKSHGYQVDHSSYLNWDILATPEVMAFGKETSNPLNFHKRLLGTSNSLVWGIDECVNSHHFYRIWTAKTSKNTQKCIKIQKISQDCVLYVSNVKCLKTDEKRTKFAKLAVSVPQLSKIVKTSPWIIVLKEKST